VKLSKIISRTETELHCVVHEKNYNPRQCKIEMSNPNAS